MWGKATYQAHPNYVWDLDVNVVGVELSTTDNNLEVTNDPTQNATLKNTIESKGLNTHTLWAHIEVDNVKGAPRPHANGTTRGTEYIEIGFIQNVAIVQLQGNFDTLRRHRRSSLANGSWYLDAGPNPLPWYDPHGAIHPLFAPAKGYELLAGDDQGLRFDIYDSPFMPATDEMIFEGDQVDSFDVEVDFWTYFAVHTIEDKNDSAAVYTQRAVGAWEFIGSGTIATDQTWTLTPPHGNTAHQFSLVTSGARIPVTTGVVANDRPNTYSWIPYDE